MTKKKKSGPPGDPKPPSTNAPPLPRPPPDPKFIWPPFPTPPPGVTIIPFSQFEPKGIKVCFGDEPEEDGEGLSTIPLLVKHSLSASRKAKGKKKKNPLAEISAEELRKMTWDKRWELGEELRTAKPLDHYEPLVGRFVESTRLFHDGRPWDRSRQELWDQFRLYTGIISGVKKPHFKKKSRYVDDNEGPEGPPGDPEDEVSDEDLMMADADPVVVSDGEPPEEDKDEDERHARHEGTYQLLLAAWEERPHFWVQETEKAIKVYLSSHFQDKGLMWSEPNARDMPIILRFYLEFVLRNKLFVEKDFIRGCEKALVVAKRAEQDLLATFEMSRAFPDEWSKACKSFWGQLDHTSHGIFSRIQFRNEGRVDAEKQSDKEDFQPLEETDQPKLVSVDYDLGEKKIKEEAPKNLPASDETILLEEATIDEVEEIEAGAPTAEIVAELPVPVVDELTTGNEDYDPDLDGWGPRPNPVSTTDLACEWGMPKGGSEEEEDVWGTYVEPSLFKFLGPSEFPARRIPIQVEKSTRVLVGIEDPEPANRNLLKSRLSTLILQPWPTPEDDPDSLVTRPQMIDFWKDDQEKRDLRTESLKLAPAFDPTKDTIRVHVDPEAASHCRLGMGIIATWVQIGRRADLGDAPKPVKGKKGHVDEWCYMEDTQHVIPSFWTANEARRDMTRPGNNPEYAYDDSD